MAIENRDLEVGTKLIARYKKEEYRAEVVAGEEGKVKYPDDRRKGVQEPFIRRNNHHQQGLQRLGVLEPRARQRPNSRRSLQEDQLAASLQSGISEGQVLQGSLPFASFTRFTNSPTSRGIGR